MEYNLVSFPYEKTKDEKTCGKSAMYMTKRRGPRTEPCGTLLTTSATEDN